MKQITQQISLKLIGGYAFVELPLENERKAPVKFVEKTIDWVEWLICELSVKFSQLKTSVVAALEKRLNLDDVKWIKKTPVTKRSKMMKNWLVTFHVSRSITKKARARLYRFKSINKWIFQ